MSREKLPRPQFQRCKYCGLDRSVHAAANLTDGDFVGKYLLICPKVIFEPDESAHYGDGTLVTPVGGGH
jgi:hypothetical protein